MVHHFGRGQVVSTTYCGCDREANWTCERHKLRQGLWALLLAWRELAAEAGTSESAGTLHYCAQTVQDLLTDVK